jgi:predicted Zn-dependent protease
LLAQNRQPSQNEEQNKELLASQYYREQQWEKAATLYLELYESKPQSYYYSYYFACMRQLKEFAKLEKFVKDVIRKNPSNNLMYEVDLGYLYNLSGDPKKGNKKYEEVLSDLTKNPMQIPSVASKFYTCGEVKYAIKVYLKGREINKNPYSYALELANMYSFEGNYEAMSEEYVNYTMAYPNELTNIKNRLQSLLSNDSDGEKKDALKRTFIRNAQKNADNIALQDVLIWLAIQEKDFPLAFEWCVSLDRRMNDNGELMISLGDMALANEDYETALKAYQHVVNKGRNSDNYYKAKTCALNARYLYIINKPNYKKTELLAVEKDYLDLFDEFGKNKTNILLMQNYAHLLAFYLDRKEEAITVLEEALVIPQATAQEIAKVKMELADIFVFTGDVWDALLLYSQVDKAFKNNPIGYEAKYRTAKLSFYMGEFEWANAQLKVLKAATDRMIANDAIELSLTISDNMEIDSTFEGLTYYAHADLLIAQHKYNEALVVLDSIPLLSILHTLNDDVMMKKAEIALLQLDYLHADTLLEKLATHFPTSILADNALYMRAQLNEKKLKKPEVAKECYRRIITEYSGSIYAAEARKELRILREENIDDIEKMFFMNQQRGEMETPNDE